MRSTLGLDRTEESPPHASPPQAGRLASAVLSIKERKSAADFARARVGAPGCSVLNWLRGLGGSLVLRSQGLEGKPPQGSAGPKVGRGGEEERMPRSSGLVPQPVPPDPALGPWPRPPAPPERSPPHPHPHPPPRVSAPTTRPGPASRSQPPPAASSPWDLVPTPAPPPAPGPAQHPSPSRAYSHFPLVPGSGPLTVTSGPALPAPAASPRPRSGSHPRPQLRPRP